MQYLTTVGELPIAPFNRRVSCAFNPHFHRSLLTVERYIPVADLVASAAGSSARLVGDTVAYLKAAQQRSNHLRGNDQ